MHRNRLNTMISLAVLLTVLLATTGGANASPRPAALARSLPQSGAPTVVTYQGQVTVDDIAFTGTGHFKFAVVNQAGDTSYWSNDGTSTGGHQPTGAVEATVNNGLFSVPLGDTSLANMLPVTASAFNGTGRYLRVWFSGDGLVFTQLSPDRSITAAPYALQADEAKNAATAGNADTIDGQHASAFAAVGTVWSLKGNAGTIPGTDFLGTTDSQALVFKTANTERMRLDTSGRLALGAAPTTSAPLTIKGAGANSEWLQLVDSSGYNQWHLNYSSAGLNFAQTGVSDYRLFLEDGGDVGIGTGEPNGKLHVENSSGSTTGRFTNLTPGTGAYAVVGTTSSSIGGTRTGYFHAQGTSGNTDALYVLNSSNTNNAAAGYFNAAGTTGMMTGVWADISGTHASSTAGFFRNRSVGGTGYAGWFVGNVTIQGTLSKSAGSFTIDHPLDPANQTLSHSFVESPDMMNVYNGNVALDEKGEAWVQLPDWFEVLNKDYRYQLTCIGGFAPVYIASEIAANRFQIGGGKPGLKVSWQVTGIRRDPYAEKYRIPVEEDKPKGSAYLCPECYGQTRASTAGNAQQPTDPDANPTR
jgi:hypothetical protein